MRKLVSIGSLNHAIQEKIDFSKKNIISYLLINPEITGDALFVEI